MNPAQVFQVFRVYGTALLAWCPTEGDATGWHSGGSVVSRSRCGLGPSDLHHTRSCRGGHGNHHDNEPHQNVTSRIRVPSLSGPEQTAVAPGADALPRR